METNRTSMIPDLASVLDQYVLTEKDPIVPLRESDDNQVFRVGATEQTILRISKRLSKEDVRFEYEAIRLLREAGLPVAPWLVTKDGAFCAFSGEAVAVLFGLLTGSPLDHPALESGASQAGIFLRRIHEVGKDLDVNIPRSRTIFTELKRARALKDRFVTEFEGGAAFAEQVDSAIAFGEKWTGPFTLIHNDFRISNIIFDEKNVLTGVVDFDWSCRGPSLKDLALAVVEWSFPDGAVQADTEIEAAFLSGYGISAEEKKALLDWKIFATLSEACTYFCDLADDKTSSKRIIKSYMYRKYQYYVEEKRALNGNVYA